MKILAFVGKHERKKEGWSTWLGWGIVRAAQIGASFRRCTHVESHLSGPWHNCSIGSSTLRKDEAAGKTGVRIKDGVRLTPGHWLVIDMPMWDVEDAIYWHGMHGGAGYSWLGSLSTIFWFLPKDRRRKNCVTAVGEPHGVVDVDRMTTAAFIALCFSVGGKDVTKPFFADAEPAEGMPQ
jgi:hypothetical protein